MPGATVNRGTREFGIEIGRTGEPAAAGGESLHHYEQQEVLEWV